MATKTIPLDLLNYIAAEWRRSGRWPLTAVLRVQFKKQGKDFDALVRDLPFSFYRRESQAAEIESERIILTPAALELTDGGLADVSPLLELARRGAQKRIAKPYERVYVTTDDLREILGPTRQADLPRLQAFCREFWAGGGGMSISMDDTTRFGLDLHSIRFATVKSGEQYMSLFNPQTSVQQWDKLDDVHKELVRLVYEQWRRTGRWPRLADFAIEHRTLGDVISMLKELPLSILEGYFSLQDEHLPNDQISRLKLRFLGFYVVAKDAEPALFVKTLPIFHEHYEKTVGTNEPMTVDQMAQRLGIPIEEARRLGPLFEFEGHAGLLRTTTDEESWSIRVTQEINNWQGIEDIDEYVRRQQEWQRRHQTAEQVAAEALRGQGLDLGGVPNEIPPSKDADAFDRRGYHRDIVNCVGKLYRDGHRAEAVEKAFKFVWDRLKERTARDDQDGARLVGQVLGGESPPLRVNDLRNSFEKSEQEGWGALYRGAWQAIRSPLLAHVSDADLSEQDALDYLTLVNMLYCKLLSMDLVL